MKRARPRGAGEGLREGYAPSIFTGGGVGGEEKSIYPSLFICNMCKDVAKAAHLAPR